MSGSHAETAAVVLGGALFADVPEPDVAHLVGRLDRRRVPAGSQLIEEDDRLREAYLVESGTADVTVADRHGKPNLVAHATAGATLGEMSVLTGEPASATVTATSDLVVLVLPREDFEEFADRFPQVYRNLVAILSSRLARASRLVTREPPGRLFDVHVDGAQARSAYALAASIAWHTRGATALLLVTDDPPDDVAAIAQSPGVGGADLIVDRPFASFDELRARVADLFNRHRYVVIARPAGGPTLTTARVAVLPEDLPALQPSEEEELRNGSLPPSGPASRRLGQVARDLTGLTVGVALGGGSIRGYAHLGVLKVLERHVVPIDFLAGTSVGAVVAGLYAVENDPDRVADMLDLLGDAMVRPALTRKGLLSTRAMRRLIRRTIERERIEDLATPLAIVTADIETQEEVILREGNLGLALLAATSIPGLYPALRLGGRTLVDGGVLDPVPISVAGDMGAGAVIAVKLGSVHPHTALARAEEEPGEIPSAVSVIRRSIEVMQIRIGSGEAEVPSITITPEFPDLPSGRLRNFRLGRRYIEAGEAAAEAALPRLAAVFPWLRV